MLNLLNKKKGLININYLFNKFNYIIYINYTKLNNKFLLKFKNEVSKLGCVSLVLSSTLLNNLFLFDNFKFLNSNILGIFIGDILKFFNILKLLDNIKFYYSYNKIFSGLVINKYILNYNYKNSLIYFNYILFKLIYSIILLLLYFFFFLIKYIK